MKKRIVIITIVSVVALIATLILFNLNNFSYGINRIKEVFSSEKIKTFFDIYVDKNNTVVDDFIGSLEETTNNFLSSFISFESFLESSLLILSKILSYLTLGILFTINIGFNFIIIGYIFAKESIN
ncbi:MAG: hypothetical protein R3Y60_05830, partial [bacterium]